MNEENKAVEVEVEVKKEVDPETQESGIKGFLRKHGGDVAFLAAIGGVFALGAKYGSARATKKIAKSVRDLEVLTDLDNILEDHCIVSFFGRSQESLLKAMNDSVELQRLRATGEAKAFVCTVLDAPFGCNVASMLSNCRYPKPGDITRG